MAEFTDVHRQILDLERAYAGSKVPKIPAIWGRFDFSPTRYYQLLDWALEQPEALEYDAQTVRRLLRLREKRAEVRAGSRLSG